MKQEQNDEIEKAIGRVKDVRTSLEEAQLEPDRQGEAIEGAIEDLDRVADDLDDLE